MLLLTQKQIADAHKHYSNPQTYKKLKVDTEQQVAQWRDASGPMRPEVPHGKWVVLVMPEKWVKKPDKYTWPNGIDASGRVLISRSEPLKYKGKDLTEYIFDYTDKGVWIPVYCDRGSELSMLYWYAMDGDRVTGVVRIDGSTARELELQWDGDRLVKAADSSLVDKAGRQAEKLTYAYAIDDEVIRTDYEMSYGQDGKLDRVVEHQISSDGKKTYYSILKYQRLPKGMTKKKIFDAVEAMLVEQITQAIQGAKLKEPACAALVQYTGLDTDETGYPPPVYLVTPSVREPLVQEVDRFGHDHAWAIAELCEQPGNIELNFDDDLLRSYLELIFQLTVAGSGSYTPVRKMFQRVCTQLNNVKWGKIQSVTDDFVVLPRDISQEIDMLKDVLACVPKSKRKMMVQRGLLPEKAAK